MSAEVFAAACSSKVQLHAEGDVKAAVAHVYREAKADGYLDWDMLNGSSLKISVQRASEVLVLRHCVSSLVDVERVVFVLDGYARSADMCGPCWR